MREYLNLSTNRESFLAGSTIFTKIILCANLNKMGCMVYCLLLSFVGVAFGGLPSYSKVDAVDYQGYNNIEDYGHYSHYASSLPAYSTVSYVMSTGHHPVSYSGFTNHGRGHHDPGYAVQYRSEGFLPSHKSHYY